MTEQAGSTLLAQHPSIYVCQVAWCDKSHDAPYPGQEVQWHGRLFAEKQFPNRRISVRAGWAEPLTRMRATSCAWTLNKTDPPYIRISFRGRTADDSHAVELSTFDAAVLSDCMRASGDGWLGDILAEVSSTILDGTPEGTRP
jgi:hypothetical protein